MDRQRLLLLGAAAAALTVGGLSRVLTAPHPNAPPPPSPLTLLERSTRPDDPKAQAMLATTLVREAQRTGDTALYHRAVLAARHALSVEPEHPEALKVELLALHHGHRFQEMLSLSRKLAEKHPSDAFFHGLYGDALLELGRYDEAAEAYQRMVDLKPSSATYTRVGYLRLLEGDAEGAVEVLKLAATSADQTDSFAVASALCELGEAWLALGEPDTALDAFTVALEREPGLARAHLGRGHVLRARGEVEPALQAYRAAVESRPLPQHRVFLADALEAAGRSVEAAALREQSLAEGRDDARFQAQLLLDLGREPARAEALAREEYARRQDVFTEGVLAYALVLAGKTEEAHEAITRATRLGTRDARLRYVAGLVTSARKDTAATREHFTAALRGFPPLPPAQQARARSILDGDVGAQAAPSHP
jgi:tetratricopeptide (TPR) repeat protein